MSNIIYLKININVIQKISRVGGGLKIEEKNCCPLDAFWDDLITVTRHIHVI